MVEIDSRTIARFWSKVDKRGPDDCWPWLGNIHRRYGMLGVGRRGRISAHRLSWIIANGAMAPGFYACHHCDNPPCVNPAHLFKGTMADNMADKVAKMRHPHGQTHRMTRLTVEEVSAIKEASGSQRAIARRFGVAQSHVSDIRSGKNWARLKESNHVN